jgi:two-component system, chemotaxis family, CheB/CheR fusion protein
MNAAMAPGGMDIDRRLPPAADRVVGTNGGRQTIDLIVQPFRGGGLGEPLYMIIFQDIGGIKPLAEAEGERAAEDTENTNLRQLEMELRATKERLQTTTEELESSNEELKSGNEELSSMNEELQSANEELETSKEELQSINEELQTVNAELSACVEELSRANSDIANLLESTQIAAVFLDRNLAIKSFTPAAKDLFRLVESDAGRPITHVRARFLSDTVQEDAERVLRTLSTIERQVLSNDNDASYVMRMLPYRTVDNVIAGVVITFVDITKITAAETRIGELSHDLRNRVQSLETLLDLLPMGVLLIEDTETGETRVNRSGAKLLGQEDGGNRLRPLTTSYRILRDGKELPLAAQPLQRASRSGEPARGFEGEIIRADGTRVDVVMTATPLLDDGEKVRGAIAAILDISERRHAEAHQQVLLHELQHRVKNIIATISALAGRMLKGSSSIDQFSAAFLGRLQAMAGTHELLSRGNWTGTQLRSLVETALHSHLGAEGRKAAIEGPDLLLTPNAAATLGMAFYELATNAAKYGALSGGGRGRLDVSWRLVDGDGGRLSLDWVESGGPPPPAETNEGFGTGFIKRSVEFELEGTARLDLQPAGFRCRIEFPLHHNVQGGRAPGPEGASDGR